MDPLGRNFVLKHIICLACFLIVKKSLWIHLILTQIYLYIIYLTQPNLDIIMREQFERMRLSKLFTFQSRVRMSCTAHCTVSLSGGPDLRCEACWSRSFWYFSLVYFHFFKPFEGGTPPPCPLFWGGNKVELGGGFKYSFVVYHLGRPSVSLKMTQMCCGWSWGGI